MYTRNRASHLENAGLAPCNETMQLQAMIHRHLQKEGAKPTTFMQPANIPSLRLDSLLFYFYFFFSFFYLIIIHHIPNTRKSSSTSWCHVKSLIPTLFFSRTSYISLPNTRVQDPQEIMLAVSIHASIQPPHDTTNPLATSTEREKKRQALLSLPMSVGCFFCSFAHTSLSQKSRRLSTLSPYSTFPNSSSFPTNKNEAPSEMDRE
ncbi:hypothetical protein V8C35DRAFT_317427 [Trichoderma chlorosporum]